MCRVLSTGVRKHDTTFTHAQSQMDNNLLQPCVLVADATWHHDPEHIFMQNLVLDRQMGEVQQRRKKIPNAPRNDT
jgi:hypothetical protein